MSGGQASFIYGKYGLLSSSVAFDANFPCAIPIWVELLVACLPFRQHRERPAWKANDVLQEVGQMLLEAWLVHHTSPQRESCLRKVGSWRDHSS